jgi:hypothetical protein
MKIGFTNLGLLLEKMLRKQWKTHLFQPYYTKSSAQAALVAAALLTVVLDVLLVLGISGGKMYLFIIAGDKE